VQALPLPVIGWTYTIVCGAALLFGAWIVVGLHLQGEEARRQLARSVLEDVLLFGIWILGFAGGVGVLLAKSWSRPLLEFFCWVLAVMTIFSAFTRLRQSMAAESRGTLVLSLALFAGSIVAVCGATIYTLRSPEALRALSGF
jgi:predicted membrane channel-forming protein YqfA (hemolysin III family)